MGSGEYCRDSKVRYREQVGELVKMRRKTDSSKAYSAWLYATKRQIVAERYGKSELQVEADVRALFESRRGGE